MTAGTGTKPVVIIDGGQSGGIAAATLREEGFGRPVLIVSGEPGIPFGKPPLSKTYLRSEVGLDGWYVRPVDWYAAQDVAVLTGSVVTGNDPATHRVLLRSGRELEYQKALIATGARNRRLQIGGAELPASTTCGRWPRPTRSRPKPAPDAAPSWWAWGFIGCEVAASLTQLGVQVSAVYPSKNPLERVLGEQIGTLIAAIHRSHGVRLLAGDGVAAFEGEERLTGVVTTNGERIGCDFAVGGVGVEPDAPAASGSSVAQQNGSWSTSSAGPARPTSTRPATSPTTCTRSSAASGWSTSTAPRTTAPPRRDRCSVRPRPSTTSTTSGPTSTNTRCSTSATPPPGTTSPSAGAWTNGGPSSSTCWAGSRAPPSASTVAPIRSTSQTPTWRPARSSSLGAPGPSAPRSHERTDLRSLTR
jgi:hypothetical protein